MRASVLRDTQLARRAGQFVWLSIDTEDPGNAPFVERYPQQVWPTFLVVDPRDGHVLARWEGGATRAQLERILDDARRALRANARADARADVAKGSDGMAVLARVTGEQVAGRLQPCAAVARAEAPGMGRGAAFAGVVAGGLSCTLDAPADAPWRGAAIDALEPLAAEAVRLPRLAADDRAGLYELLVGARSAHDDSAGARRVAERWWTFLESERRRASSAEARAALDSYRVSAALALGDPARALPALAASERELPADYNPPARTARLLLELRRLPQARDAVERALRLAYGPRKVRIFELASTIAEREGDRVRARALVAEALAYAEALPEPQRGARTVARLEARRRALSDGDVPASDGGASR